MYQERVLHSQTERLHQVQGDLTREPQYHPRDLHFIQDGTSTNTSNDSVLSVYMWGETRSKTEPGWDTMDSQKQSIKRREFTHRIIDL